MAEGISSVSAWAPACLICSGVSVGVLGGRGRRCYHCSMQARKRGVSISDKFSAHTGRILLGIPSRLAALSTLGWRWGPRTSGLMSRWRSGGRLELLGNLSRAGHSGLWLKALGRIHLFENHSFCKVICCAGNFKHLSRDLTLCTCSLALPRKKWGDFADQGPKVEASISQSRGFHFSFQRVMQTRLHWVDTVSKRSASATANE